MEDIHGVSASKWIEVDEFQWQVTFGAGELIREEPFVTYLNKKIALALSSVDGVIESYHEDTEKYVISGQPRGEDLVRNVSVAVDSFAKEHLRDWLSFVNKI